jgi:membrane-bound lytic murein transglycosylase D
MTGFPANMVIQSRFLLVRVAFFTLLTSGAFAPFAIAAPWPEGIDGSILIEHAVQSPPLDDRRRPDLSVEQTLDGVGSGQLLTLPEQLLTLPEQAEWKPSPELDRTVDPWAEAFAESSRRGGIVPPKPYPLSVNPQVKFFLDRFTGNQREVVGLWVGRAGRYLGMIRSVLRSRDLPEELAYTAMIESGFNPLAVSRAGAKGMWQFMAGTARRYGLRVDHWIDERLDPEKSTVAAASYLRDLYNMFGSWNLAQAAYNAGEVKVSRAMRATGSSDFWTLARTNHLRTETKEFVPQIHAATLIGLDPMRYGFEFTEPNPADVEHVTVPPATDLRRLATTSGVTIETLRALNPVLVRAVTPPGASWNLRVPAGSRPAVVAAVTPKRPGPSEPVPVASRLGRVAPPPSHDFHVVRSQDTVSSIAKKYGVSVGDVLRWNRLQEQARIHPGDRLRIADARPSVERDGQGGFR